MNSIIISLLKGSNSSKIILLKEQLKQDKLLELCETKGLKSRYNLEKGYNFSNLEEISKVLEKADIEWINIDQSAYPEELKKIYDPPFLLYIRGNINALYGDIISVVGTRKPSIRGYHETFRLGLDLGKENIGVVSGLATGIDSASHLGNLTTGGKTIAVLGSGIDTIYPKGNRDLAGQILQRGGAIVSEFPPGEEPKRFNFPKRNRVIAGLSRKLVIVQAPKKSGALITGDFALENGADIYVHSVGVNDKRFLGSDKFYKDGATKIDSALPITKTFGKSYTPMPFDRDDFSSSELIKMELDKKIIKYKGSYFSL